MSQLVPAVPKSSSGAAHAPRPKAAHVRTDGCAADAVEYPSYDRNSLGCGIVHLGVGSFHRSHLALYVHEYLQRHASDWMIHGVATSSEQLGLVEAIGAQGCLFTMTEHSGRRESVRVIGSTKQMTHAPSQPGEVERLLVCDSVKIVALTLSEAGYPRDALGDLDVNDSLIRSDLRDDGAPLSAFGHVYAAAFNRMRMGGEPFTVLSCDDIPFNGDIAKRLMLQFAELKSPEVADWIRDNVSFPNSMIDRVMPATSGKTSPHQRYGIEDNCAVLGEAHTQWVIEDRFKNGRPLLATVGVQFTDHIGPYEAMKARLLKGTQTAIAYVARMLDHRTVADAMRDPLVRRFAERYMDEASLDLDAPYGYDLGAYKAALLARLSNDGLRDKIERIAANGSQNIAATLVPLAEERTEGGPIDSTAFAIAAWCRFLRGVDEHGSMLDIVDPLQVQLTGRVNISPKDPVHLLSMSEIFGKRLPMDGRFIGSVSHLSLIHI